MKRLLLLIALVLLPAAVHAQQTVIVPSCVGVAATDTAKFTAIKTTVGSANPATIKLPYKLDPTKQCKVNNLTLTSNITLDNTDGSGVFITTGQTLTTGPIVNPPGKKIFFNALAGQGTVVAGSKQAVVPDWWAVNTTPGATDMSPAIQASWNSILATGGTWKFVDGSSYRLTTLAGQSDANYQALVGIDPGVSGLTFNLEGNAQIISSVKTGTSLARIVFFFIRGNVNVTVSGLRFKYDGGASATKLLTGFNFGLGDGYFARVSDCEFRNFFNSIVTTDVHPQDLFVHHNRFIAENGVNSFYSGGPTIPGQSIDTASTDLGTLEVVNNWFDGCADNSGSPAYQDGLVLSYSKKNTITGNQIAHYGNEGIYLVRNTSIVDPPSNAISGNTLSGTQPTSVAIRNDTPNTVISGNTSRDTQIGIFTNINDDPTIYLNFIAETVQIVNNSIYMTSNYVSGGSVGILSLAQHGLIADNTVVWPQAMSGYGSVVSSGIKAGAGSHLKISHNNMVSFYRELTYTVGAPAFVAGEQIVGSSLGARANIYQVGPNSPTNYLRFSEPLFGNTTSFGNFAVGEVITGGTSGATATIASFVTPAANTVGILLDATSPSVLDNNKTSNMAQGIKLRNNAGIKNGPFDIINHESLLDTSLLGSDFDPSANLRFVYRSQETNFSIGAVAWHRILTALDSVNGRFTISLGTEQIAVVDVNYIASGAPITGTIKVINRSLRSSQYVTAIRVGIVSGTTIAVDVQVSAAAMKQTIFVGLETSAANQFLLYDVATRKTLSAPVVNPSAPSSLVTAVIGGLLEGEGTALTIGTNTITPTNAIHQVGAGLIKTITVPAGFIGGYASGSFQIVPTAAFTYDATGNILGSGTAVVGRTMIATYSSSTSKWSMSY